MKLYYVAHPVAGDVPANIARALRWLKWLSDDAKRASVDVTYIAPWIAALQVPGVDDDDPAARARGLEHDCNVVKRCDGIVLVGGRVSSGMAIEREAAREAGRNVIDLTALGEEPPS